MRQRFKIEREPTETWAVLDKFHDRPVELDGKRLVGLGYEEASLALYYLNVQMLRSSLDVPISDAS